MDTMKGDWRIGEIVLEDASQIFCRAWCDGHQHWVRISRPTGLTDSLARAWQQECDLLQGWQKIGLLLPLQVIRQQQQMLLVYQDFPGITLEQWLTGKQPTQIQKLHCALQLLAVLGDVHQHGWLLRNLHPNRILINPATLDVKLFDLCCACPVDACVPVDDKAEDLSSLAYCSPEQSGRTNIPPDHRSDFYALGVLLYRIFTGTLPFHSNDANNLIYQHLAKVPLAPKTIAADVAPVISNIIMKLLAKSPSDRYQSASGLQADLQRCLTTLEQGRRLMEFDIGLQDRDSGFALSPRLYGRDAEMSVLQQRFAAVRAGGFECVFLAGYSGIGKSRIIHELQATIKQHQGFFCEGKFEQFKRDLPYGAFVEALTDLVNHVLSQPRDGFTHWQMILQRALGSNGAMLIPLMPDLELIIGPQPELPSLSAIENENRIKSAFIQFCKAFASEQHPLVLFLDDLQWADTASLRLIETLAGAERHQCIMLIGAYRDNEVDGSHPLWYLQQELKEQKKSYVEIQLTPLAEVSVTQFIADTLQADSADVAVMARILYGKTLGNPFFLARYLTELHEQGIIGFDVLQRRWQWDDAVIQSLSLADNVVELLSARIRQYPAPVIHLLMMASLLGARFRLEALAAALHQPVPDCFALLGAPVADGLLVALDDATCNEDDPLTLAAAQFKFAHDRIQQAARELAEMTYLDLDRTQLELGRALLALERRQPGREPQFEIAEHINLGKHLVREPDERLDYARLNFALGMKAKKSSAYRTAWQNLTAAHYFLGRDWLQTERALAIDVLRELAECAYLDGEFSRADMQYPSLAQLAQTPLDKIRYLSVQANQYQLQGRFMDALQVINRGIELVGLRFPADSAALQAMLEQEYAVLEAAFARSTAVDAAAVPEMTDPLLVAAMELLRVQWYASYLIGNVELNSLISLTISRLSLQQGLCDVSAFGFVTSALVANLVKSNSVLANTLGEFAIALADARDNISIRGTVYLLYTTFTRHWHHAVQGSEKYFKIAWECSVAASDYVTAGYVINVRATDRLIGGRPLGELEGLYRQEIEYLKKVKQKDMEDATIAGGLQPVLALTGKTASPFSFDDGQFSEAEFLQTYRQTGLHQAYFYQARIRHAFVMQAPDMAQLADHYQLVEQFVPGQCKVSEANFYGALIHACLATPGVDDGHLQTLQQIRNKFQRWEVGCKANFLHKRLLLDAEIQRLAGQDSPAFLLYEQAIDEAEIAGFSNCAAVGCERYAVLLQLRGLHKTAALYINRAYHWYGQWGATLKQQFLVQGWPQVRFDVRTPGVVERDSPTLDMQALFKATNVISRTVKRQELTETVLQLLKEYSGATYAALVHVEHDQLSLLAHTHLQTGRTVAYAPNDVSLQNESGQLSVPHNLVSFVHKTRTTRVMNQPDEWDDWSASPYFRQRRPLSIICHPITGQSGVIAILYLENHLTTHAFNNARLQAVNLIAQQAAVSIDNAVLYEQMESRIDQRTYELVEAKQKAEEATEAKSQFLAKMSHEIRTPLNAVIGLSRLAMKNAEDLEQQDFLGKILESADVLLGLVNHILDFSKIEAGKLVIESVPFALERLLQQAINLNALKASAKGLELVMDIDPQLPAILHGDPLRLQQILVNLISNAVKFTDSGTVLVSLRRKDETPRKLILQATVSDTGIGLTPDQQARLFQSFTQADDSVTRKYGGSGLGLVICKQLCELMGGGIWLESEKGQGTRFHFSVVLEKAAPQAEADTALDCGLRALIVDDNAVVRDVLQRLAEHNGLQVDLADSGTRAIEHLQQTDDGRPPYDVVLLDWFMPDLDGLETWRYLQHFQLDSVPVYFMISAYDREAVKSRLGGAIAQRFLEKPVSPQSLRSLLRQLAQPHTEPPVPTPFVLASTVPDLSGYRILLVEDNAINRQVALGYLADSGVRVDWAEHGAAALERLQQTPYDLVLMDVQMPVMDGLTATRHIRNRPEWRQLPVIAMTAHALAEDRVNSRAAGMNEHITKPLDPGQLFQILQQFLQAAPAPAADTAPESALAATPDLLQQLADATPLDVGNALRKLGGKRNLYLHLLKDFYTEQQGYAAQWQRLRAQGDDAGLLRVVHSLKSNAAYVGAQSLAEACAVLEAALLQGTAVPAQWEQVATELDAVQSALANCVAMITTGATNTSMNDLRTLLEHLAARLKKSDFAAEELVPALLQMTRGSLYAEAAERIASSIAEIEFERAAALTATLWAQLEEQPGVRTAR